MSRQRGVGSIGSLATYARINQYGFIETPYRRVEEITDKDGNKKYHVMDVVDYLTADQEDGSFARCESCFRCAFHYACSTY